MPAAKYTFHIPTQDEQGQPLKVHNAVHQHLINLGMENPILYKGEPHHSVSAWAEDTPEWDSTAKQIGAYAGEIANVPSTFVTKEGGKAPANWPINNNLYRPGEGAEQSALASEPDIATLYQQHPDPEPWLWQNPQEIPGISSNPLTILTSIHAAIKGATLDLPSEPRPEVTEDPSS